MQLPKQQTNTLVVGANGATGRLLVEQLLERGQHVKAMVRPGARLPGELDGQDRLTVVRASVLELSDHELAGLVADCQSVASCLGHHMSWKGIYGQPRRLVTDAARRLTRALAATRQAGAARFVLMNTAGNRNRDLDEPTAFGQRLVVGLIRVLLPPHADNEQAADYLRTAYGQGSEAVEWVVVRPDSLTDEAAVTAYELHASPTRSAIFDPGTTSRINVAHFMAELISDDATWNRWKGQMPVIYNGP
jgi:nucleoside-diphosphate-sugar epimerase